MISLRGAGQRADFGWVLGTAALCIAIAVAIGAFVAGQDDEGVRGFGVIAAVAMVSLPIFYMAARNDPLGPVLFRLLIASLTLKLGAVAFRLWFIFDQYRGGADAVLYHVWGTRISESIWMSGLPVMERQSGTHLIRLLTGIYYAFTGPTLVGAFVFWAWLGLLGMLFFYKAFTIAFPRGDRRLYAYLILLYPSMLLWTSSVGKDALVCFSLGLMTYGAATLTQRINIRGGLLTAAGLLGILFIRPHISAIAGVALAVAFFLRPFRAGMMTPVVRAVVIVIFAALGFLVVSTSASFLQLEDLSAETVVEFIDYRQEQTERGGAAIHRGMPTNPLAFADGLATVFFRPYPWEAHNVFAAISAVEGVLLLILLVRKRESVTAALTDVRRSPFLMMSLVFIILFAFFFSAISNFGIIARQRPQMLPFVFMWLAFLPIRRPALR